MSRPQPCNNDGAPDMNIIKQVRHCRTLLDRSARLRFSVFSKLLVALFAVLFFGFCLQLLGISRQADEIDDKWIANTRLLGEVSDRLTELRLAQAYIVLANDSAATTHALQLAAQHRQAIRNAHEEFLVLDSSRTLTQSSAVFETVEQYLNEEQEWERAGGSLVAFSHRFTDSTDRLYKAADEAVDSLIDGNAKAARFDTSAISRTSYRLLVVIVASGLLMAAASMWMRRKLETNVFAPLEGIAGALARLSAGEADARIPSVDRDDEIGSLAQAFQRFRQSAQALEEAYTATKLAEQVADRLARHDSLTGLANRRMLSSRIDNLMCAADTAKCATHFVYVIDLDRFKAVNDLHGHEGGDTVLCTVAARLRALVREEDVVARLGGDEFAVVARVEGTPAFDNAAQLATRIGEMIRAPIQIGHSEVEVGSSIGIALCGRDGHDAATLLRAADAAMYRAKSRRCGDFQFFEESMQEDLRCLAALELDVRNAVAQHAIEPHYQPLVDLRTNRTYGFEILARWTHPARGSVEPDTFIPVIERLGLATTFTLSMLRRACRDARLWPGRMTLALNLSPHQLADPLLPAQLLSVLSEESFEPSRLEIEITESALVGDLPTAKSIIDNFRRWGIRVSLDDFGTGYSSLHHLRELHFDKIKIDRSFIQSMLSDAESAKIVDAILCLSDGLGLTTLAEGIESAELQQALTQRGCAYGQGFLFGKAVRAEEVAGLLRPGQLQMSVSA